MLKLVFTAASLTLGFALSSSIVQSASAQITIRSTGVVTGTVVPPSQNPNFNQGTTRVDVDAQGRFFRNGQVVYSAQDFDPSLIQTDGQGRYWVDFRGIPIVSTDGTLTSPALSNGELQPIRRNHNAPTRFHGTIQDELVVRGRYTGTAIDPTTGLQYQGTFDINGQGPRYSDRTGGTSPTVFDFRSHYNFRANPQIPPRSTVSSFRIDTMPVRLTITIPAGLAPIQAPPTVPGVTPTPNPSGSGATAPPISPPSINVDPTLNGILNNNQIQQVSRVVLEGSKATQIGPSSRILLRR